MTHGVPGSAEQVRDDNLSAPTQYRVLYLHIISEKPLSSEYPDRHHKILLIFKEIIFRTRLTDVNKVIRYLLAMDGIVSQILTRTYIHAAIYLPAVSTNDFSALGRGTRQWAPRLLILAARAAARLVLPLAVGPNMVIIEYFMPQS